MPYYVVIDTNVLVSALLTKDDDSATVKVVRHMITGTLIPLYSDDIFNEYREVLMRKKFGFKKDTVEIFLSLIQESGIKTEPAASNIELPDIKDLPFYETLLAVEKKEAYLVTGNLKHFPVVPSIVTPRQMIDFIEQD